MIRSARIEKLREIDRRCSEFERAWRGDASVACERFLDGVGSEIRSELLHEFLLLEWELNEGADRPVALADYLARFPSDAHVVSGAWDCREKARRQHGASTARRSPDSATGRTGGYSPQLLRSMLLDAGLVPDDLLGQAASPAIPSEANDGAQYLRRLIDSGVLTEFQAAEVAAGRARRLSLNDYTLLDQIGAGGMGCVYRARHRRMNRDVAVKIISPNAEAAPAMSQRFRREVQVLARLRHPNIVTAYDAGVVDGVLYLAMQLIEGESLASLIKSQGPLPLGTAVGYVMQAARGLQYAHERGVVHRDVKPANLLLGNDGVVTILDLGLARYQVSDEGLTGSDQIMGSIDYMSPEQAMNAKCVDARSDVYSLGCTLWYLLTGKRLYEGELPVQRVLSHREAAIPALSSIRTDLPGELTAVMQKMLAKRPEDRFATMPAVIEALKPFTGDEVQSLPAGAVASARSNGDLSDSTFIVAAGRTPLTGTPREGGSALLPRRRLAAFVAAIVASAAAIGYWMTARPQGDLNPLPIQAAGPVKIASLPVSKPERMTRATSVEAWPLIRTRSSYDVLTSPDWEWTPAEEFGPKLPDGATTSGVWLAPDGLEMIISLRINTADGGLNDLYISTRSAVSSPWSEWTPLPDDVNSSNHELWPTLTADGRTMIFCSSRETPIGLYDLFSTVREGRGRPWAKPVMMHPIVQLPTLKASPCLSGDGRTLVFSGRVGTGSEDLVTTLSGPPARSYWVKPTRIAGESMPLSGAMNLRLTEDAKSLLLLDKQWTVAKFEAGRIPNSAQPLDPNGVHFRNASTLHYWQDRGAAVYSPQRGANLYITYRVPRLTVPAPAAAPFDAGQAAVHQKNWANYLQTSVDLTNSLGMEMKLIPPGSFMMGMTDDELAQVLSEAPTTTSREITARRLDGQQPLHHVTLTRPFRISATEVTVGQMRSFTAEAKHLLQAERKNEKVNVVTDPVGKESLWDYGNKPKPDDIAMSTVTWRDAVEFCNWLSVRENRTPVYRESAANQWQVVLTDGYRLPTEAEWEFACRAGTATPYFWGEDRKLAYQYAWLGGSSGGPRPVRTKLPNPFGLYDMQGSVKEWVNDVYDETYYAEAPSADPPGPTASDSRPQARTIRGTGWFWVPDDRLRSAHREGQYPDFAHYCIGFRVAHYVDPPSSPGGSVISP